MTSTGLPFTWLVQTKLRPPLLRPDVIGRAHLLDKLRAAAMSYPLTIVSAPAGSGKTTVLATLAHLLPDGGVGWISLDEQDNDPAVLRAVLVEAFQRIHPPCGALIQAMPAGGEDPRTELRQVFAIVINELFEHRSTPITLVLDDLHVITEPAIHQALDYLIEHCPPQLHLVIATRSDPSLALPRLRARRRVAEFRLPELCFTVDEATQLLNDSLGLGLARAQVQAIHERTEGWAAGVSLLASSLERMAPDERDRFLSRLQQTDRAVFDYLAEEVLEQQDPFVRMFLLETSILPKLNAAACATLTGRDDSAAILDDLYRRNLFLVALDQTSGAAYRYHDLFAGFLRERLQREHPLWLRELHRRAAQTASQPARKVHHYLDAGLLDEAASVIEAAGDQLLQQGALTTLRQLIEALPAETRTTRPALTYLYGLSLYHAWELAAARPWLERAARERGATDDHVGRGEVPVYLADTLRMLGDYAAARSVTEVVLAIELPPRQRARLLLSYAWQALADGQWQQANAALDEMLGVVEQSGEGSLLYSIAVGYRFPFIVLPGGVERAERLCRLLATHVTQPIGPLQAELLAVQAWTALLRGRWDDAAASAAQAVELSRQMGGLAWIDIDVATVLWVCQGLRADVVAARQGFDAHVQLLHSQTSAMAARPWEALLRYLVAKIEWLFGEAQVARDAEVEMHARAAPTEWPIAPICRSLLQALIAIGDGRYDVAEELLWVAQARQADHPTARAASDAQVLLAYLYLRTDRSDEAIAELAPVLARHEQEDTPGFLLLEGAPIIRPLLRLAIDRNSSAQFAARVLSLLADDPEEASRSTATRTTSSSPNNDETLTPREQEILRLLMDGASNQVIADALVISLHTVKRHVTNILQKLQVSSRLEAVARARELRII